MAVQPGAETVFCGNCGTQNSAGQKFCSKCGAPLASAVNAPGVQVPPTNRAPAVPVKQKKKGGFLRGCLIAFGVLVLIGVIANIFGGNNDGSNTSGQAAAPAAVTSASEAPGASEGAVSKASSPAASPADATASSAAAAQDVNKGITFGEPVSFAVSGLNIIGVPVTNTTDQVKSFTVKATYKVGEQIAATASGAVNDLLPGQTRAVSLLSQDAIPATFDSVRVDVDTMIVESTTTPGSEVAAKLAFGQPAVKTNAGLSTVDVEVTNNDTVNHSFTVQAMFLQGDKLVGIATGAVNDLAPGQTKTATLLTQGTTEGADVKVAVDTLVQ